MFGWVKLVFTTQVADVPGNECASCRMPHRHLSLLVGTCSVTAPLSRPSTNAGRSSNPTNHFVFIHTTPTAVVCPELFSLDLQI
jgi:hypothetical protein